jgi:hypothetical protein
MAKAVRPFLFVFCVVAGVVLLAATPASADDFKFGIRGGYYTNVDAAFVGAEFLARVAHRVWFNPNVEYAFVDDSYLTFNLDFHYDFPTHSSTYVWLGGGLAIVRFDPPGPFESDTDVGANFLGGVGFRTGTSVIPYFQAKVIAKSDAVFAIAFGLRF